MLTKFQRPHKEKIAGEIIVYGLDFKNAVFSILSQGT